MSKTTDEDAHLQYSIASSDICQPVSDDNNCRARKTISIAQQVTNSLAICIVQVCTTFVQH